MGKPVRSHSSEYTVSHIEKVVREYGVGHIFFEDDNLTFKMKRTKQTCELILEKNINITWSTPNGVRADKLTKPLLVLMKKTGCTGLIVGTESGDQDTLDNIVKKDLKLETVIQVAKWCKDLKIPLTSFFVIGFPKETKQKIQNTIDFAANLYEKYQVVPLLNVATPLIGTVLYDEVVKDQLLVADLTPHNLSGATQPIHGGGMITTSDFTPDDLRGFAEELNDRVTAMDSEFDVTYHV
jgi:magnesium-protoporphyrin IX monomethyl ester (oxidative) cyclase